jgi:hypothetical protein
LKEKAFTFRTPFLCDERLRKGLSNSVKQERIFARSYRENASSNTRSIDNPKGTAARVIDRRNENGTETLRRLCAFDYPQTIRKDRKDISIANQANSCHGAEI